ncbi:MAG: hydrolase, TatD family [Chloroflexi bacterium]|nr:hydrolase, TatD family [Chloroflexota bacterium]
MNIIDTHAHLDMPEFDKDLDEVVNRAREAGVQTIITIGIDLESSRKAISLAEKYPGVLATVGVHPQESKGVSQKDIQNLAQMARHPRVVAIGEIGLDFYRHYSPRENQLPVLQWELELAAKTNLPIVVHCRQAQIEMLTILKSWAASSHLPGGKPRGVIHCFSGDSRAAEQYLNLGFYISLGGYIGYPSSASLRETIKNLPLDRLILETDCPFLPPQPYRGKRNEPSYTIITAGVLAELKHLPLEELARQTTRNAGEVFNLPGENSPGSPLKTA